MEYRDFSFNTSKYGRCEEYSGTNAVILAIKNILLSRPGNFPFTPNLGLDIGKYQFSLLDEHTLSSIKTELLQQINTYIPTVNILNIIIDRVEGNENAIGIYVSAMDNGEQIDSNFVLLQDHDVVSVFNESI